MGLRRQVLNSPKNKKRVLFVCGGNTCRSPMAKVIPEQMLKAKGQLSTFGVDSTAYDSPTYEGASNNAREDIRKIFGVDLLASHRAKKITPDLMRQADLILVMGARMKRGLPPGKTWTLNEFAGRSGDVADPFGGNLDVYLRCAREITTALEAAISKL
jgi:protein-tyrosine-phosphatase